MITIDIERSGNNDDSMLIVSHPTGVIYEAQTDGVGCWQSTEEGFVVNMGGLGSDFNDCNYGCSYISSPDKVGEEIRKKLSKDLDEYLKNETEGWTFTVRFDFDRVNKLQEAWWPVILKGKMDNRDIDWKGYLHTANCD